MAANASSLTIRCDGTYSTEESMPSMGHPAIFLVLRDDEKAVVCPYCGQCFEATHS